MRQKKKPPHGVGLGTAITMPSEIVERKMLPTESMALYSPAPLGDHPAP